MQALRLVPAVLLAMNMPPLLVLLAEADKEKVARQYFTTSVVDPVQAYASLGKRASGLVGSTVVPAPVSQRHLVAREYIAALKTIRGSSAKPSFAELEGYMEAKVLAAGLSRMKGGTREDLVAALESLRQYD